MKNEYGDGTVFFSKAHNEWIARWPGSRFGLKHKVVGYGKTKERAIARRDKALTRALRGKKKATQGSVEILLKKYFVWIESSDRTKNTIFRKEDRLNRYLKPYKHMALSSFGEAEVSAILKRAKNASKSETKPKIPNQIYSELHQFLDWAVIHKYIDDNPTKLLPKPKWKSKARANNEIYIDKRIALGKALLNFAATNTGEWGIFYGILLIASLGLRAGEIRGSTWDCFTHFDDNEDCVLYVKHQWQRDANTGKWEFAEPKTEDSIRKVPIPAEWKIALQKYKEWLDFNDAIHQNYPQWDKNGFLFLTNKMKPYTQSTMSKQWIDLKTAYEKDRQKTEPKYVMDEIDRDMRLYDMRHVVASVLISSGRATIDQMRPILGHIDRKMTEYYTHLTLEAEKEVMSNIPELMGNTHVFFSLPVPDTWEGWNEWEMKEIIKTDPEKTKKAFTPNPQYDNLFKD
jgi:integrase